MRWFKSLPPMPAPVIDPYRMLSIWLNIMEKNPIDESIPEFQFQPRAEKHEEKEQVIYERSEPEPEVELPAEGSSDTDAELFGQYVCTPGFSRGR